MAIIDRLALSRGGGIIPFNQRAEQVENIVNIFIGLGGTGVDCLREIKTQIYSRIKPDGDRDTIPIYDHIKFLGIDCDYCLIDKEYDDYYGFQNLYLSEEEIFPLKISDIKTAKIDKECHIFDWISEMENEIVSESVGTNGIRQVGRFLLMNRSDSFMTRFVDIIYEARKGLKKPKIVVHIFSGLSGAIGSGTFLDVCYMVKEILKGIDNSYIAGYFFLPDVNASHVKSQEVKEYISVNGYAAMQELDYCMNLPENGGSFEQVYKGGKKIKWDNPPVDFCHLISSVNDAGTLRKNAYDYAIKTVSEYAIEFIIKQEKISTLVKALQYAIFAEYKRQYGYNLRYLTIGASCASVPIKEINTYLVSRIFELFNNNCRDIPSVDDVNRFAIDVLGASQIGADIVEKIYEHLYSTLQGRAAESYIRWDGTAREIKTQGNEGMVYHYENQTSAKIEILETQSKAMLDSKNNSALISRLHRTMLDKIITNIYCGPIFGYNILNGANKYSLNIILDGLIALNSSRLAVTDKYTSGKRKAVIDAQKAFEESNLFNEKSTFNEYVRSVWDEQQHTYRLETYKAMDSVIRTFQRQINKASNEIYSPLKDIFANLRDTFDDNRRLLKNGIIVNEIEGFDNSLIDINDPNMKQALENELRRSAGVPDVVFKKLVLRFMDNMDYWNSEAKISKLVTDFFVGKADKNHVGGIFENFANKTIENFLEIIYDTQNKNIISDKLKRKWLNRLNVSAQPLFYKDSSVYPADLAKLGRISVPAGAQSICNAAKDFIKNDGDLTFDQTGNKDRIFFLVSGISFPISALKGIQEPEKEYYRAASRTGTHYYEGMKGAINIDFDNWYYLPFLTPASYLENHLDEIDGEIKARISEGKELFEKIKQYKLYDNIDGKIIIKKIPIYIFDRIYDLKQRVDDLNQITEINNLIEVKENINKILKEIKKDYLNNDLYEKTNRNITLKGQINNKNDEERLIFDSICYSPVIMIELKKHINEIENVTEDILQIEKKLNDL